MSIESQHLPGGEDNQKTSGKETGNTAQKNSEISPPHTERAEGPFEHSGETAGWTKEEKEEKDEQGQENS